MSIQFNMSSASANRNLKQTDKKLKLSTEKLSTGYRINSAADDAAGLTISEKLRWQIRGLDRASENIQDGISLTQVADGALQEVHVMMDRMEELAVQAANDTNTDEDRAALQNEIDQIKNEINRISTDTEFNEIRIFKPTNVPEIKGYPADILVYHEDVPGGGVREGGIIYNGKRYAYEDMENLSYDANGNINAGEYEVSVYAEDDTTKIGICLLFDGGDRVPSGRKYELDPRNDGIYIDLVRHEWKDIKDKNGVSLDPDNIKEGTYSFHHAGLTISFDAEENMDLNSLLDSLKKDGLESYTLRSTDVTTVSQYITPSVSISNISPVDSTKQHLVPGNTGSNSNLNPNAYRMYADDNEIYMYIDAANSMTGKKEILTRMTWKDLGLNEWTRYNPDPDYNWVNPDSNVSLGENLKLYTYSDTLTGISVHFAVDSEVSKGELINAINEWKVDVTTNNKMNFTATPVGGLVSVGSHSPNLDAYGTQYDMGRVMSTEMTLASNQQIAYAGGTLSFPMTDGNAKTYTFSLPNAANTVKSKVEQDLRNYISRYASAYERRLNGQPAGSVSPLATDSLRFNSDMGGYFLDFNFNEDFTGWLDDSLFTKTRDANGKWHVTYTASDIVNHLGSNISDLTDNIVADLTGKSLTIKTDPGPTTATNSIKRSLTTSNKRYSSLVISGDRGVKIQAGCRKNQYIEIKLPQMNTAILKLGNVDVTSFDSASAGLDRIRWAIDYVSGMRSGFGSTQNRLEAAKSVDDSTAENSQAAESLLRDADMAEESVGYAKNRILQQAGQSVLAQANHQPDFILKLLA